MAAAVDGAGDDRAQGNDRLPAAMTLAAGVAAGLAAVIGCGILLGWWLEISFHGDGSSRVPSVNPSAALGLVLGGAAYRLLRDPASARWARVAGRGLAGLLVALGVASLCESLLDVDLHLARAVVGEVAEAGSVQATRMAPNTAMGLSLVGLALLLLHSRVGRWWPAHGLAAAAGALGFLALVGYTTDVRSLYGFAGFTRMALPVAVSLMLLGLAVLLLRPERGALRLLVSQGPGGVLARRVLPGVLVVPVVLAYLRWLGETWQLVDTEAGLFLFTMAVVVLVAVLVWLAARSLDRAERAAELVRRTAHASEERAEADRRQARDEIDQFFSLSLDMLCIAGTDGIFKRLNPTWETVLGYRTEELVGLPFASFVHPDDVAATDREVAKLADGAKTLSFENRYRCKDGTYRWLLWNTAPMPERGLLYAVARDTTEHRRAIEALRAHQEQTSSIIATASDAFVGMDAAGKIIEWNRRAEELFGWSRPEAIGRGLAEMIIPERYRDAHRRGLRRVLIGGEPHVIDQRIEINALHRDHREIPIELAVWRLASGSTDYFNAFIRDISQRKRIEEDLADARDRALEASRVKSEFLATMSHEIRTPMNGVIGLTGLLLDSPLNETQRRYAEGIRTSGNVLLSAINDILDFSKIEAGKLVLDDTTVNLVRIVEEVTELVADTARGKGLELVGYCDPALPAELRGDPVRLRQILLNFATNAVKFTAHGEVLVQARPGWTGSDPRPDGDAMELVEIRFEVVDSGIGISATDRERLFVPFSQVDASTTRRFGGSGLGLAICRELATAMGGQIGVDSRPDAGSTFWCVIPLRRVAASDQPAPPERAGLGGLRVLVVDDNDTNRLILSHQLRNWAASSTAVESGGRALDELRSAATLGPAYDLVLLDMRMPGMDGLEVAGRIRADPGIAPVPVVLLTSDGAVHGDVVREAGIAASLMKPVHQSQLYDCLIRVTAAIPAAAAAGPPGLPVPGLPVPGLPVPGLPVPMRGHLLLVEDNEINQLVALGLLAGLGYTVDVAGNGLDALEMVDRNAYQAVLMDCQMPKMDGFEATGELRRRERAPDGTGSGVIRTGTGSGVTRTGTARLPIIAMTASALQGDRERCLAAGMDDYISKPVRPDELGAVLDRWVAGRPPEKTGPAPQDHQRATDPTPASALPASSTASARAIGARLAELREPMAKTPGDLVSRVVDSFLERSPAYLADLDETLARRDSTALAEVAHSLNGAAGNLGATAMAGLCQTLEFLGRGDNLGPASEVMRQLHQEHHEVRRILRDVEPTMDALK